MRQSTLICQNQVATTMSSFSTPSPALLALAFSRLVLALSSEESVASPTKSFYVLFANQIDDPQFPIVCQDGQECIDLADYSNGIIITQPQNITKAHIDKVKREVPGSTLLGYFDFQNIPIESGCSSGHVMGDRWGRNCSTTYQCGRGKYSSELNKTFPSKYAANELVNGTDDNTTVLCKYPGLALHVWFKESADLMSKWLADWIETHGFDGTYLDGYTRTTAYDWQNATVDVNGDGKPDSEAEAAEQYSAFAPYFAAELRSYLGPNAVIVSNSAGALSDMNLNGLTIEMEACTDYEACMDALQGQYAISAVLPKQSVLWLTHSELMPAEQQCEMVRNISAHYPWVQSGTDFFDGSHVVCNTTRSQKNKETQ